MTTYQMVSRPSAFTTFTRNEWANLSHKTSITLTADEREQLQGLNETISAEEVTDIYLPLSELIYLHMKHANHLHKDLNQFFQKKTKKVPFVIGIAGSVSVGKSTTARLIQTLISRFPTQPKVDLVTTDGFLLPNAVLEERGLMKRKGFPESYDIESLLGFLTDLKSGCAYMETPLYSHLTYDRLTEKQIVEEPDVVIVEGINVLQVNKKNKKIPQMFVSDFFDFSIYVDAEEDNILNWYIERFKLLRNTAFQKPESFFHRYRHLSDEEAVGFATDIWKSINGVNLERNIRPTKNRADLILKKGAGHRVEEIMVKKK
ncbi:pantothenate kinase [Alkalihalophilus pseudofirmus OF4]|uniref:Pantothenate kinase n=3 Tax=Alkalihalophilus TaxID=2893060 RepID=D3FVG1_ALKPO|nr:MULTISPECIES: type I pantothenate kinase [Alkalihalophilus]ADC48476.1 pantothenate kinase [Alkalihalophilus pseudofirmus OF4]ERN52924.1 pantothenate kinase [Alkalihalophilus marmarensis DSM 21297]MCM3489176.1 type I pantothenate kinase [Alkalihalophilus marmarensis]MDV2885656.1 type I pantothenate kinase [Alkalihalophilus pseudofirmus]MED1601027.1 type I pantothenate kinase [Alkalihalophilus marmarensis]